jgi:hypothetical protein
MDSKFWSKIGISAIILGLFIFAFNAFNKSPDIATILLPPVQASTTTEELKDTVILARSEIAVQEKGHLARAAFAIDNNSNHDIKNVEILCTLMDNTGTEQGRDKWVIYDTIKAHSNGIFSSTSKKYIGNRASASQCQIVDIEKSQSPLIAIHRGNAADTNHGGSHEGAHDSMPNGMHH